MRHALPLALVAALSAGVAFANPISMTTEPRVAADAVAGVATITIGTLRANSDRDVARLVAQVKVGDRWETVKGTWVSAGPPVDEDSGSGLRPYHPWGFAVALRDGPVEVRLARVPSGFRWTGERLVAEDGRADATPPELEAVWPSRYGRTPDQRIELPARSGSRSTSWSLPEPRGAGALALVLGGLLLVTGAGRRRDAQA